MIASLLLNTRIMPLQRHWFVTLKSCEKTGQSRHMPDSRYCPVSQPRIAVGDGIELLVDAGGGDGVGCGTGGLGVG